MQIKNKRNETLKKLAKAIGSVAAVKIITENDLEMGVVSSRKIPKILEEAEQRLREVLKEFRAYLVTPDSGVEEDITNEQRKTISFKQWI